VLGPRWAEAVVPLRVLAGFALVSALSATTGDVFKATGRSVLIFRVGLVHSVALWAGLAMLASRGVAWVALAVTLATLCSSAVAFTCAALTLRLRATAFVRALWAPVLATLLMTAVLAVAGRLPLGVGPVRLGVLGGLGVVSYVAALWLLAPGDVRELGGALAAMRGRRHAERGALAAG
jgi:PST family polysaccharide transporter